MQFKDKLLSLGLAAGIALSAFYPPVVAQQTAPAVDLDYQTAAILYTQKAAEYRALCYQAFNIARLRFDADLEKKNLKKLPKPERKRPRAIVVDIDETVLANISDEISAVIVRGCVGYTRCRIVYDNPINDI